MAASLVRVAVAAFVCLAFWSPAAVAEDSAQGSQDVAAAPPLYQLPKVGKPTGRVGGGRRSIAQEVAVVAVRVVHQVVLVVVLGIVEG